MSELYPSDTGNSCVHVTPDKTGVIITTDSDPQDRVHATWHEWDTFVDRIRRAPAETGAAGTRCVVCLHPHPVDEQGLTVAHSWLGEQCEGAGLAPTQAAAAESGGEPGRDLTATPEVLQALRERAADLWPTWKIGPYPEVADPNSAHL